MALRDQPRSPHSDEHCVGRRGSGEESRKKEEQKPRVRAEDTVVTTLRPESFWSHSPVICGGAKAGVN